MPNTACTGQVRAFAHTFGILAPTADSASGGFFRQVPPLPVTPAVGLLKCMASKNHNKFMAHRIFPLPIFLFAAILASCTSPVNKSQESIAKTDTPVISWVTPQVTATPIKIDVKSKDILNRLFERLYSITACKTDMLTYYLEALPTPAEASNAKPFVEFIEVNVQSDPYMKSIYEIADNDDKSYQAFVACENREHCHPKIFVRSSKIGKVYELNWSGRMAWRDIQAIIWIDHSVLAFFQSNSPQVAQVIAVDVEKKDFVYYSLVDYDCPLSTPTP